MNQNQIKLFQAIGELFIPLLGYFVFDWSLYFILLFLFIDLLASEVFTYIKVHKTIAHQGIGYSFRKRYRGLIVNTLLMLTLLFASHLFIYYQQEEIDFSNAFIDFLKYEEPGFPIPQGYLLLPLVVYGNYQQYKLFFIQSSAFKNQSWKVRVLSRRHALKVALIGSLVALVFVQFLVLPDLVYLVLILSVKFYIDVKKTA